MTLVHANSAHARPDVFSGILPDDFHGLAIKIVCFSLVPAVFVFVSILLTGIHP